MQRKFVLLSVLFFCFFIFSTAYATFDFSDDRFQGVFTTENINAIIKEYELHDGWYWTTPPNTIQTFHGIENAPGWTDTSVNRLHKNAYKNNYFGCRWYINKILEPTPGQGGYGECFGFAQFLGYLLSGDYNPHKNWDFYYQLDKVPNGLQVGDIIRTSFKVNHKSFQHSAVVYSISDNEILFIQVSGGNYNRIVISGFSDGYHLDIRKEEDLAKIPNKKICRSPINQIGK